MKHLLLIFISIIVVLPAYSQTNKEKALSKARIAIEKMDNGETEEAIVLLEEAEKLDPGNITYPYEIAYAHYLNKDFDKSVKILKKLRKHDNVTDRVYQMLGNSYDLLGDPEKAVETYEEGLEKFPSSGILYLERGNIELVKKEYVNALGYYEKGISVEPEFPSNYYWVTKLFLGSSEEVWGMLYGESFLNLERNTRRTEEISKLLFETYKSQINFESDSTFEVSFTENSAINVDDISDLEKMKLPYALGAYEQTLIFACIGESGINLESLNRIRKEFIDLYYKNGHHKTYPENILFQYQKEIEEKGYLEAYNYWVLMKGDEEGFVEWRNKNPEKWGSFISWFSENPIPVDNENYFHRLNYFK